MLLDVTREVLVLLGFGDDGVVVWVRVMETGEARHCTPDENTKQHGLATERDGEMVEGGGSCNGLER